MKRFFCTILIFSITIPCVCANEDTTQPSVTVDNSLANAVINEEKPVSTLTQPMKAKPRNKWDFSDRKEDKIKKEDQKSIKKQEYKRPKSTSRKKWGDTSTTDKAVTSNRVTNTQPYQSQ